VVPALVVSALLFPTFPFSCALDWRLASLTIFGFTSVSKEVAVFGFWIA